MGNNIDKFKTFENSSQRKTPLLDILRKHSYDIVSIHQLSVKGDGFLEGINLPSDKGYCFNVFIDYVIPDDINAFEEIVGLDKEGWKDQMDEYNKELEEFKKESVGKPINSNTYDQISFYVWLDVPSDKLSSELYDNDFFKEACLLAAKKELLIMITSETINDVDGRWDHHKQMVDEMKELGQFMTLSGFQVENNTQLPITEKANRRLGKNSYVLNDIKEYGKAGGSSVSAIDILKEIMAQD